jgi:uncharacterized membrane protein
MRRLLNYFLRGLALIAPAAITIYVCWRVFTGIDRLLGLSVPGLGFVITIALITLVGFVASNLLARTLLAGVEAIFTRLPFVRLLYTSSRDLFGAFVGEKRRFDKPVLVTLLPQSPARWLGFITRESLAELGLATDVAVYLPQSYNFAGQLLVLPSSALTPLDAASSEVMAFIVSGGVTGLKSGDG